MGYKINKIRVRPNGEEEVVRPPLVWNGDLSKATYANRTSFTPTKLGGVLYALSFNDDGTNLFISNGAVGNYHGVIQKWTLSTPRDITTASNREDIGYNTFGGYPGLCFADDGNILYANGSPGSDTSSIYRYSLTAPYDLSDLSSKTYCNITGYTVHSVSSDGKNFLFGVDSARTEYYCNSSTAWEPTTPIQLYTTGGIIQMVFCNKGKNIMCLDNNVLKKFELGTPYDLTTFNSTPIQTQSTGLSGQNRGIYVDEYGNNIYICVASVIYRYNLV